VLARLKTLAGSFRRSQRIARGATLLVGLVGTAIYASALNPVYPIRQWLFWPLAMLWGWVALFSAACASFGQLVLVRVLRAHDLPRLESAVMSMAVGVVAFVMAMYLGGALGWYGTTWALLLPSAMLVLGAPEGYRLARDLIAEVARPQPRGPLAIAIGACGVVCLGVLYLQAMTPESLNYDSVWYHVVVAQDYARAGRIIPFLADYNKNFPQLTPLIHTWGWLLPGMNDALRWMLVLHSELGLFLWTLAGVAAAIRMLTADQTLRGAWVAFFLFPIIFVYDNNIGGAADHVCAFFSVPMLLAALRLCATFSLQSAALLAIASAGAALTKYQAMYMIAATGVVVAMYWLRHMIEHRFPRLAPDGTPRVPLRNLIWAPVLIVGLGLLLVSPHFIRGIVFYKNPVYPLLRSTFPSTPNIAHSAYYFDNIAADPGYRVRGPLLVKIASAIKLFFTFSMQPHYSFTHNVPAFGSLFTLLLPTLPFVRNRARIAPAAAIASGAVLAWAWVYFIDRNLQTFMPVLVCVTGALVVELWRLGGAARFGLAPLLALQIVWGADALFYSGHERIEASIDLIRSGFEGKAASRFEVYRPSFTAMKRVLPEDAVVLLHTSHVTLGIDRDVLFDWAGYQALITYQHIHTPRELYTYLRSFGVTHLLFELQLRFAAPSKQEEVVWNALVTGYGEPLGQFGVYRLVRLPAQPPPEEAPYQVATLGLWGYADGIYPIDHMGTIEYLPGPLQHFRRPTKAMPAAAAERAPLLETVDAIFVAPQFTLESEDKDVLQKHFKRIVQFADRYVLYLRKERVHHPR
jgi:hypothetical protein